MARERAGLSQRQLAFPGCTAAYISRIEAEARAPSLQIVFELADRVGCDPWWLATGKEAAVDDLRAQLRAVTAERDALRRRLEQITALTKIE